MTIWKKIYIYFGCCSMIPFIIMSVIAYNISSSSLKKQAFNRLVSVRETKKAQIEDYFSTIRKQVRTFSENGMVVDAMKEFKEAFKDVRKENDITDSKLEEYRTALKTNYTGDFTSEYKQQNSDKSPQAINYFNQLDDDSIALQYHYIKANGNRLGEKHNLDSADDKSTYSKLHARYHPVIRDFLEQFGYYDIFLVDPDSGDIVYSVYKELDFTTSLISGPYANTNFGKLFQEANKSNDPNFVKLVDFEPYAPSYEGAASFIASPIYDGSEKVGILLFQMPIDNINAVMTSNNDWKSVGLGDSGETYLIGEDLSVRSQSRFLIEDKAGYFAMMKELGADQGTLGKIKTKDSTILLQKVETKGTRAAISGAANVEIYPDYRSVNVLGAYAPVGIEDVNWGIMAEIDMAEAFAPVYSLRMWALIIGCILAGIVTTALILITSQITQLFNKFINNITQSSYQYTAASNQISSTSQTLAQGASEQASMTNKNARHVEETTELVDKCNSYVEDGNRQIDEMNRSLEDVKLSNLKIAEFTKVIDDIANKTDLLAVNAAIEAANAGEYGKGFSVVADEVRNLAQRSSSAANETANLINCCVEKTVNSARYGEECKKAMENIKNITKEQKEQIHQINLVSREMDSVTQQNAATAEETASASEELNAQAQTMKMQIDDISLQIGCVGNAETSFSEKPAWRRPEDRSKLHKQMSLTKSADDNGGCTEIESSISNGAESGLDKRERFDDF